MNRSTLLLGAVAVFAAAHAASATTVTYPGQEAYQGTWNTPASGLVNIVNPLASPNQVNTSEWSISKPATDGNTLGTFATSGNDGEMWTKVFDHSASANSGPWGDKTSKVCCNSPAGVTMISSTTKYSIVGYELTTSNDSPGRDPNSFTFEGTPDGGATWLPIDSNSTAFDSPTLGRQQTVLFKLDSATIGYNGFRFTFPDSQSGGFAVAEIEVFGTPVPEPTSLALLGFGTAGLLATARRRRNR